METRTACLPHGSRTQAYPGSLPRSRSCPPDAFNAQVHVANAWARARFITALRPCLWFTCRLLSVYERGTSGERGTRAACPGIMGALGAYEWQPAGSTEPKALAAPKRRVINNAGWILASPRAEKIIPGWNWASGRGHGTLETAGLEILKRRALENWVSPCRMPDFFSCPLENWEVNWPFIARDEITFLFFFPFPINFLLNFKKGRFTTATAEEEREK